MNAVTQLASASLEEVLANYDIGQLVRYWPAANGIENSNYFVQTLDNGRKREFVLTIMEQPAYAGHNYVTMMEALAKHGLPVAAPIRDLDNHAVIEISNKPAMLQYRLTGRHIYNPTQKQIRGLGRFMARMHLAMAQAPLTLDDYPRDTLWLRERATLVNGYLPFSDQALIDDTVTKVDSLLSRRDVNELPRGMIHGDLFRDNLLFDERGLTGVLDFHHAANGFWIYDLAVAANDWCNDASGRLDPERTTQLLSAYHKIRPLTSEEVWFFSGFTLYAALTFWLSRLAVALDRKDKKLLRFKNPDEFRSIVQHHTRHHFYIDERRLAY